MSDYTIEIVTGINDGTHNFHTWIVVTSPSGQKEAWGLYPATDELGNIVYGPGDIKAEDDKIIPTIRLGRGRIQRAIYPLGRSDYCHQISPGFGTIAVGFFQPAD